MPDLYEHHERSSQLMNRSAIGKPIKEFSRLALNPHYLIDQFGGLPLPVSFG